VSRYVEPLSKGCISHYRGERTGYEDCGGAGIEIKCDPSVDSVLASIKFCK